MTTLRLAAYFAVSLALAKTVTASPGIALLDDSAYREAIGCGRTGEHCAVTPYALCPSTLASYTASLATPYSRVAGSVYNAIHARRRVRPMELRPANQWGAGIYVFPATGDGQADSIQRVTLTRGSRVIEPVTTTLAPVTVSGGETPRKELAKGYFAFPMGAFAPGESVTITFTGARGHASCTLDADRLSELR